MSKRMGWWLQPTDKARTACVTYAYYSTYDFNKQQRIKLRQTPRIREDSILFPKRPYTHRITCSSFRGFLFLIYIEFDRSRFLRAVTFSYIMLFISFYIILRITRTVSVGYYSDGKHLARLKDSALACRTHPATLPPKYRECLAPDARPGSLPA